MKYLKKFESFTTDDNRGTSDLLPKYNPVNNQKAKEFVDSIIKNNYELLFKLTGTKMPKDLRSDEMDPLFDEVREKAIKYFEENPELIGQEEVLVKKFNVNGGDGIPRMSPNLGGTSHAASLRVGESVQFGSEIEVSPEDLDQFKTQEPLIQLVRDGKVALGNNKIRFNKTDKKTAEVLDIYFEFDKNDLETDDEF